MVRGLAMKSTLSGLLLEKSLRSRTHSIGCSSEVLTFGPRCRREKPTGFKAMDTGLDAVQATVVFSLRALSDRLRSLPSRLYCLFSGDHHGRAYTRLSIQSSSLAWGCSALLASCQQSLDPRCSFGGCCSEAEHKPPQYKSNQRGFNA